MTITHAFFDVLSSTIAMTIAMSPIDMMDAAEQAANAGEADVEAQDRNTSARTSTPPMPGAYPYTRRQRNQPWKSRRREEAHLRQHLASRLDHLDSLQRQNKGAVHRIERLRKIAEQLRREEIRLEEENRRTVQQRLARAHAIQERQRRERIEQERIERERIEWEKLERERIEREAQEEERLKQERLRQEEERLERERAQWQDARRRLQDPEFLRQSFERYDAKWGELRAGLQVERPLWAEELPWPVHDIQILANAAFSVESARAAVKAFVLHANRPGCEGKSARQRLRAELLRWHPDKFRNQVLPKVQAFQREDTFKLAQQITVFLNDIVSEL